MMDTFLSVTPNDLRNLTPEKAVELFAQLLWAEASSVGIGKNLINIPNAITVSDGGIDAEVKSSIANSGQGIIKQGKNCYQIKTGEFSLSKDSNIDSILFKDKTGKTETRELQPRVKSCLDDNGFLIIVLFGYDLPDKTDDGAVSKFREKLQKIDPKYESAKIEVWRQNQIIGFLQNFPSLRRQIIKTEQFPFFSHKEWHGYSTEMQTEFIIGKKQQNFINKIQEELRKNETPVDIRITGTPGSGKTRIAYEITRSKDLSPLVIYFESPQLLNSNNFVHRLLRDEHAYAILIVDECNIHEKRELWNKISTVSPRIKLMTIYNERDDDKHTLELPDLENEIITNIIAGYGISKDDAARFTPACSPSPRLANWLGQNLISNSRNFSSFADSAISIYELFIANKLDLGSHKFKDRKTVLMWFSLFRKVGYESPHDHESKIIAQKIKQDNPGIGWQNFLEIVEELRKLKVLQGYKTLYITPGLLHLWLWREWWKLFGKTGFDISKFIIIDDTTDPPTYLPGNLMEWFTQMFVYASESPEALKVVQHLLGLEGIFGDGKILKTEFGARFFSVLAKADHKSALDLLDRTVARWNKKDLLDFTIGRREVLWALEEITVSKDNFSKSANLLLLLAESENETVGNNATNIFSNLFSMAPGKLAYTQAPIQERLDFLNKVLDSKDKEKRILGLGACNDALESLHFSKTDYAQGKLMMLSSENWQPGQKEISVYESVLNMLCSRLDTMEIDEQKTAMGIIIKRSRALTRLPSVSKRIVDKLMILSKKSYVDLEQIISEIEVILHYDAKKLDPATVKLWENLKKEIHRDDFPFLMKRHVMMDIHTDDFDENGVMTKKSEENIKKLAKIANNDKRLLIPELDWLVTTNAKNGFWFGLELGTADTDFVLLPTLLEVQVKDIPNPSGAFLGGYFQPMFQKNVEKWEKTLDFMCDDPKLCTWVPEIIWRSGMTDKAGLRLVSLVNKGIMKKSAFSMFIYGAPGRQLSEKVFLEWIKTLLTDITTKDLMIAIPLFYEYYGEKSARTLPEEITLEIISNDLLFADFKHVGNRVMDEYYWTGIAKKFVEQYSEKSLVLGEKMLQNMGKENIFSVYHSETLEVLDLIGVSNPDRLWGIIQKYVVIPLDERSYKILEWMKGDYRDNKTKSIWIRIQLENIWAWVDADKDKRAPCLARFVPKVLIHDERCMAREVLIRYGDVREVGRQLHLNFGSGDFWTGSGVDHYTGKKEQVIKFKENETDANVLKWLDDYISYLDSDAERMKSMEEREF